MGAIDRVLIRIVGPFNNNSNNNQNSNSRSNNNQNSNSNLFIKRVVNTYMGKSVPASICKASC